MPESSFITLMPHEAVNEINNGRLPQLKSGRIILQRGEYCCFVDKAYMLRERITKQYSTESKGVSRVSLLSIILGEGIYSARNNKQESHVKIKEIPVIDRIKGLLYITNHRIIFVSRELPFDKPFKALTVKIPYLDGIQLQFGGKFFSLLLPDGELASEVIDLITTARRESR
jgi:hypothetical protein